MGKVVTNGGSAIGEAIGHYMEEVVQECITDFLKDYQCHFLKETGYNPFTGKASKKLLLYDQFGNDYNIDGVITNESMQPLVLLESKYIRYKKHNRDKGSWICNAHTAIRKRYPSIRASIAVLAGNWSKNSLAMIRSHDVNIFLIPFQYISTLLAIRGIDFEWEENEKDKALKAWTDYSALSESEKKNIAIDMVASIKVQLQELLRNILDDNKARSLQKVIVEIYTNKGETKRCVFESKEAAVSFLENLAIDDEFNSSSFISVFDIPILDE